MTKEESSTWRQIAEFIAEKAKEVANKPSQFPIKIMFEKKQKKEGK